MDIRRLFGQKKEASWDGTLRVAQLETVIHDAPRIVWLQMRYWSDARPVRYYAEHEPFLVFVDDEGMRCRLRADEYGMSWRCFRDEEAMVAAMDAGEAAEMPWADGGGIWVPDDGTEEEA